MESNTITTMTAASRVRVCQAPVIAAADGWTLPSAGRMTPSVLTISPVAFGPAVDDSVPGPSWSPPV
jgi:hypothetical protein